MKLKDLAAALAPYLGDALAQDLARDFLQIRQDHATGTLERASPGKFVETVVQCLQHLAEGRHEAKPNVDAYLRDVEGERASPRGSVFVLLEWRERCTRCATRETLRIRLTSSTRTVWTCVAHHASSWIVSEFLRSAVTLSMDEAGKLIALMTSAGRQRHRGDRRYAARFSRRVD